MGTSIGVDPEFFLQLPRIMEFQAGHFEFNSGFNSGEINFHVVAPKRTISGLTISGHFQVDSLKMHRTTVFKRRINLKARVAK